MSDISPTTAGPTSRTQIARYAGAVQDFNPIHVDEEFAKAAGMPSVIAHGPLSLTLVIDALVAQVGPDALRRFDARLLAPVFPGDTLHVTPSQDGVEVANQNGTPVAKVALDLETA